MSGLVEGCREKCLERVLRGARDEAAWFVLGCCVYEHFAKMSKGFADQADSSTRGRRGFVGSWRMVSVTAFISLAFLFLECVVGGVEGNVLSGIL